jgi:hypothetical protein
VRQFEVGHNIQQAVDGGQRGIRLSTRDLQQALRQESFHTARFSEGGFMESRGQVAVRIHDRGVPGGDGK